MADRIWAEDVAAGMLTYGRPPDAPNLLRLMDWRVDADGCLRLWVQPTWYWTQLGTNRVAGTPSTDSPDLSAENTDVAELQTSALANPLTVNVLIIAGPPDAPKVLVQRVGRKAGEPHERYHVSAAGYVETSDALSPDGPAWTAIRREALEEADVDLAEADVTVLGLCRSLRRYGVGLCAVARLDREPWIPALPRSVDPDEIEGFEWWPWDPITDWQADGHFLELLPDFRPLGAATVALAALANVRSP